MHNLLFFSSPLVRHLFSLSFFFLLSLHSFFHLPSQIYHRLIHRLSVSLTSSSWSTVTMNYPRVIVVNDHHESSLWITIMSRHREPRVIIMSHHHLDRVIMNHHRESSSSWIIIMNRHRPHRPRAQTLRRSRKRQKSTMSGNTLDGPDLKDDHDVKEDVWW